MTVHTLISLLLVLKTSGGNIITGPTDVMYERGSTSLHIIVECLISTPVSCETVSWLSVKDIGATVDKDVTLLYHSKMSKKLAGYKVADNALETGNFSLTITGSAGSIDGDYTCQCDTQKLSAIVLAAGKIILPVVIVIRQTRVT